jgi:hypothetical protein
MTQNIMTSALEASGPIKYFLAFSILLDGLAHISAIFLLKMQKKSKIGSPYCTGAQQALGLLVYSIVHSIIAKRPPCKASLHKGLLFS